MPVQFEPLPSRSADADNAARALRARPGDWALVAERPAIGPASNFAYRIRTGKLAAFRPAGAFEAHARSTGDEGAGVWARYVGATADPAKAIHR
ncbi:hypothetical protein ACFWBH_03700 [Streptomyces sp. NPDC059999]|uniref:hypothetical protein n=1 Tax=Streptomyces sp. NPDC059999 TaxID=3347030 RepID=UPI0036A5BB29